LATLTATTGRYGARSWQKAALDVEEGEAVDGVCFIFGDVCFKLKSQTSFE